MFFASSLKRQAEQGFTLGLSVEIFLQMHATRLLGLYEIYGLYNFRNWANHSNIFFFFFFVLVREHSNITRAQWVMWDGSNHCSSCIWGAEPLGGGDPLPGRSSTEHCDFSISMFLHRKHQEGTASGTLICLFVHSMLKWKFKVQ